MLRRSESLHLKAYPKCALFIVFLEI